MSGGALVVPLASFVGGETLMRTRLDLQLTGISSVASTRFPTDWEGVQIEAALCWDQGPGGGDEPPGYFDTGLFPWIWAQQVSFQTDCLVPDTETPSLTYATYINTAESRGIDCHSARATDPENVSTLWFVLDVQTVQPDWAATQFIDAFSMGYSVMSKLPA